MGTSTALQFPVGLVLLTPISAPFSRFRHDAERPEPVDDRRHAAHPRHRPSPALLVGGFDPSVPANTGFLGVVASPRLAVGHLILRVASIGPLAALVGFVDRVLVAVLRITLLIATLGVLTFVGGYAGQLSGGQSLVGVPPGYPRVGGDWGSLPTAVGIAAVLLLPWLLLRTHGCLLVRRSARPHRPAC